jgi:hypothetical protein
MAAMTSTTIEIPSGDEMRKRLDGFAGIGSGGMSSASLPSGSLKFGSERRRVPRRRADISTRP